MIKSLFTAAVVLACVSHVQAEECFISSAPSMDRIVDSVGVLQDNKKGRMLPVIVNDVGRNSAIQVEFVSLPAPYDIWNGVKMFARAPIDICEVSVITAVPPAVCSIATYTIAKLECTGSPFYMDWNALGVVNVWHEGIVPGGTYNVRVIDATCNTSIPANYSGPTEMQTAIFGDTVNYAGFSYPVDDAVDIIDALAGIATFTTTPLKPSKSRTELSGRCINHKAGIDDILRSLRGFTGGKHSESLNTLDPCESSCPDP